MALARLRLAWPPGWGRIIGCTIKRLSVCAALALGAAVLAPVPAEAAAAAALESAGAGPSRNALQAPLVGTDDAVSYRINPAHTGAQADSLAPPIKLAWSAALGGRPSYPLIAAGRVYVIVQNVNAAGQLAAGTTVVALDAASGSVLWRQSTAADSTSLAYDQGRIYLVGVDASLTGLNATTGAPLWTSSMARDGAYAVDAPLVAANGKVFGMANSLLEAFDGSTGTFLHETSLLNGNDMSSPALDGGNVFVTGDCGDYSVSTSTGATNWSTAPGCSGGTAGVPALSGGNIYDYDTANVLSETTGSVIGHLPLTAQPVAVDSGRVFSITSDPPGFWASSEVLRATSSTGATLWTFYGDGYLDLSPVVANGVVYAASRSGIVYLLGETTGRELFHVFAGELIDLQTERGPFPRWSMAIGEGLLAVPTATSLAVFAHAPAGTATTDLPAQHPPQGGYFVTDLGSRQDAMGSRAVQTAGQYTAGEIDYQTTGGPIGHPVIWGPGGYTDWTTRLPAGTLSAGFDAVNGSGIAAGGYEDRNGDGHGITTTSNGTVIELPNSESANAINTGGVVAGFALGPLGCSQAATWTGGVESVLPMGSGCGGAYAINDSGEVAGFTGHAAVWVDGVRQDLGLLGGCASLADALSPDGTPVGWSDKTTCGAEHHAVEWRNGFLIDLGTAGGVQAAATAIGPDDQPVGLAEDGFGGQWDVIWRSGLPIVLQSLIDPSFGWLLGTPTSVDLRGRITGNGTRYGMGRGFILTPVVSRAVTAAPTPSP